MTGPRKKDDSDWASLLGTLRKLESVSTDEVARLVRKHTSVTPRHALRRLKSEGVLTRAETPRRGLYVVTVNHDSNFVSEPIEAVKALCGAETVFGYGTALFMHGLSRYGMLSECYVLTQSRRNRERVGGMVVRFVRTPVEEEIGVISLRYGRTKVRVTDTERTLIDCIHRPKYAQGWENVLHALERAQGVKGSRIIEYVKEYATPSLVAKVGWIAEQHARKWKVRNTDIESLFPYLPRTPVKFARGEHGVLNRRWMLYAPEGRTNG